MRCVTIASHFIIFSGLIMKARARLSLSSVILLFTRLATRSVIRAGYRLVWVVGLVGFVLFSGGAVAHSTPEIDATHGDEAQFSRADGQFTVDKNVPYQEFRVGNRLESVIVRRANLPTETYKNNRSDTVWVAAEVEIGEVPNLRWWTLGAW